MTTPTNPQTTDHSNSSDGVDDLRDELAQFIRTSTLAPGTAKVYRQGWRRWESFCRDLPGSPDPLDAPREAYQALLTAGYSPSLLRHILAGIRYGNAEAGRTPVIDDPSFHERWEEGRRGGNRLWIRSHGPEGQNKATPLDPEDVPVLLASGVERSLVDEAYVLGSLLMLDASLSLKDVATLQHAAARERNGALAIALDGPHRDSIPIAPCRTENHVNHGGTACIPCSVRKLQGPGSTFDGTTLLLGSISKDPAILEKALRKRLRRSAKHFTSGHLTWCDATNALRIDTTDPSQVSGIRIALSAGLTRPYGQAAARAKARFALAWANALRMISDVDEIERHTVVRHPAEGFSLRLGPTKGDRLDAREMRAWAPWEEDDRGAARYLDDYLTVRDATVGTHGHLFTRSTVGSGAYLSDPERESSEADAERDLAILIHLAGLTHKGYTTYSVRRGNATARHMRGQPLERIQRALRHLRPETSVGYIDSDRAGFGASEALMRQVAQ